MAILQTKTPKVSVIIVNFHTDQLVLDLIKKIGESTLIEIILIDNSSTRSIEKKLPACKSLIYVPQDHNLGFSGANNIGIQRAKGEWVLLLNSDTITSATDILNLVTECELAHALVGAPQLINADKSIQESVGFFDTPHKGIINWLLARPRFAHISSQVNARVDCATGAALLINKSIFEKVGLLDEDSFFMYFEDIDFCYRLYKEKISILYVPTIHITHIGGKSSDQNLLKKSQNYTRARSAYIKKHRGTLVLLLNKIFKLFV